MMDSNGVVRSVKDRKCYTNTEILFFMVLLFIKLGVHSFALQTDKVAVINEAHFDVGLGHGKKYGVVDNIEVPEMYIIDGVMHEGHPILMYKEDFVNEDFVANRHKTLTKKKNIGGYPPHNTIEHYNALKLQKIYFDILLQTPILISDDENASETKFVAELVPLVEKSEVTENFNVVSEKGIISNHIKKLPRRRKRDIKNQNPYNRRSYYYTNNKASLVYTIQPQFYQNSKTNFAYIRHPVQGKPPIQPYNIGARGDFDDHIWGPKSKKKEQMKPFSSNTDRFVAITTLDTPSSTSPPNLWHDSNPDNFDFSQYDSPFLAPTPSPQATSSKASNCVWAIVNCCAHTDNKIRYYCFEEFSCHGAFWGLNPCADKVRDNAISYLDSEYA